MRCARERIVFLGQIRDGFLSIAEESVRLACAYKGVPLESPSLVKSGSRA